MTSTSTDLDMYYQKVGDVYDRGKGRPIRDFPSGSLDFRQELKSIVLLVQKVNRLVFHLSNLVMVLLHLQQSQLI